MELTFPIDEDLIWDEGLVNRKFDIIIPDIYTSIGDSVFSSRELTSVRIPGSVTSIGDYAFYGNKLTSVRVPDSVTSIGEGAFWGNQLTSALIAESVTSIGDDAFYDNQLSSYAPLPYNLTSIGARAFAKNQLARVDIPDSVTSIGDSVFYDNQLTSVRIRDSVTSIGARAFAKNKLESVDIPDSVTTIKSFAFSDNQLTSVVIPDSVTSIGDFAFSDNPSLESISISEDATFDFPNGVNIIRRGDPSVEWDQITEQSSVTNKLLSTPISIGNRSYSNAILGTLRKDRIIGTASDEIIAGGAKKDKVKGGAGADVFVFNAPGGFGNKQMDVIRDFSSSQGDSLVLSKDQFGSLASISFETALKRKQVKQLASSSDSTILYMQKSGKLYYNENGSEDGFGVGGVFAKLKGAPELGASDFTIV